jgi:protoheme IX farnesyltransferase
LTVGIRLNVRFPGGLCCRRVSAPDVRIVNPLAGSGRLKAYVALTKPRIIELLLITTIPAMVIAAHGWPGTWLVLATLVGGTLSAGGANAINNVVDRDIDVVMRRTHRRPLPREVISPRAAFWFGAVLGTAGFVFLWVFVNLLAALLSTAALLFYVLVYTMLLKRNTSQNIVIGGAAGGAPALVGWAAVTGSLTWVPWLLFSIVFLWTPAHFWALAMRYKDDYEAAGIPMLPVLIGERGTSVQIVVYAVLTLAATVVLWPVASMGVLYGATAVALGVLFVFEAVRLLDKPDRAMSLFIYSTVYLTILSGAMVADVFLR